MQSRKRTAIDVFVAVTIGASLPLMAQQPAPADEVLEEVVVTGSQIRGAVISDALPISIVGSETIEVFGIDSGDQLLDLIPENGNNFVNEVANISGGVNSAGGDVGAFNLRSLGTGNTLVLLNGRRMVNSPQYQTEQVGGSFVPVNSVNSNMIPTYGIDRRVQHRRSLHRLREFLAQQSVGVRRIRPGLQRRPHQAQCIRELVRS